MSCCDEEIFTNVYDILDDVPTHEHAQHTLGTACRCAPRLMPSVGGTVVVHKALPR